MTAIITPLILLGLSVGMFFGVIQGQWDHHHVLADQNSARDTALSQADQIKQQLEDLMVKRRSLDQSSIDRLQKMLPDAVDTVRLIMDINGIASKYGILIKKIDINKEEKVTDKDQSSRVVVGPDLSPYGTLKLSFSLSATYENFTRFLSDLEQSLRITDVSAITIGSSQDKTGQLDFGITAKTYWLK